jgi:hypothetical protein
MVNVPSNYASLVSQMSSETGIPQSVIAAQANDESGFNATAVSSAGAEGWLQFLPSTYNSYTAQAGVAPGSEFNPADEAKVYSLYMNSLLKQEGGNLRNALAAYNAGPANLSAGYGYADSILAASGQGNITVSGNPTATTAGFSIPGLGGLSVSGITSGFVNTVLKMLGLGDLKDMMQRLGLIILGFTLVIVGIHLLASGGNGVNITTTSEESNGQATTTRKIKTPVSQHTRTATRTVGADEAVEAAAVA